MTWKPTADIDEEVRSWMKAKGWEVTVTDYHFDQEIYAWRHKQPGGKSPTLRTARYVLEHFPAWALLYHLDRLRVTQAILAKPKHSPGGPAERYGGGPRGGVPAGSRGDSGQAESDPYGLRTSWLKIKNPTYTQAEGRRQLFERGR